MHFRVTVRNLEPVLSRLSRVRSAFRSEAVWAEIGTYLKMQILVRTARGVDVDGQPFVGYSSQYKLFRVSKGRSVGKVNLFFSGTMLSSIDYEATDRGVRLFFLPTEAPPVKTKGGERVSPKSPAKAYYLQTHKTKPREFFGINAADVVEITKRITARVTGTET